MSAHCPACGAALIDPVEASQACPACGLVLTVPPAPQQVAPPAPQQPAEPPHPPIAPPHPEWIIAASIGTTVALLLAGVVAWRLSDNSLLPTVESLGGPDNVDSVVPIPPPVPVPEPSDSADDTGEPVEIPTEVEVVAGEGDVPADSVAEPAASASDSPAASSAN